MARLAETCRKQHYVSDTTKQMFVVTADLFQYALCSIIMGCLDTGCLMINAMGHGRFLQGKFMDMSWILNINVS